MTKEYFITCKVTWTQNVEASSIEEAKEIVKETMKDEYNFDIQDVEITDIEES